MKNLIKNKQAFWYAAVILVWALLYAVARFPGVDAHSGYFGMTYSIIHPESFPEDLNANFHPAMVSWYTLLVKLSGDLWLDDRFNLFIYFILVVMCMWGLDRIIKLFGVKNRLGRLGVLAILLAHHSFIDNVPRIIDTVCYRPSTYLYPLGIWLAYFLLKGDRLKEVVTFIILSVFMSVKNAWFPGFMAMLLIAREKFDLSWSKIVGGVAVLLALIFVGNYFWHAAHNTLVENAQLFDLTLATTENSEANPFMDGLGPFLYVALLIGTFFVKLPDAKVTTRVQSLCAVSLIVYLLAGVYYTFAPNAIKVPFFVALAVSRSTWWTQILIFAVLSSFAVIRLAEAPLKKKPVWGLMLFCLYQFPGVNYPSLRNFFDNYTLAVPTIAIKRFMLISILLAAMLCLYFLIQRLGWNRKGWISKFQPVHVILLPLIICATLSVTYKLYTRLPHVAFLFKHGIVGDSPGAKWVGINEFLRYETEKDSTVLSLVAPGYHIDTSLRIRTGRTMPLSNHAIAFYFDYQKRKELLKNTEMGQKLSENWVNCDYENLKSDFDLINNPDYLVISDVNECDPGKLGYNRLKEINSFVIAKKMN